MPTFRVLVTGGRRRPDEQTVWDHLTAPLAVGVDLTVVHGDCPQGVDGYVDRWCRTAIRVTSRCRVTVETHPASDFGSWPACGPKRNAHMVRLGADLVLAYPDHSGSGRGSPGTYGCVDLAVRAGLPVTIHRLPDDPPKRVQRRRVAGWRKPPAAVCVTRPGRWGNPDPVEAFPSVAAARQAFRAYLSDTPDLVERARRELAGRDLACYCAPDAEWCHANDWLTAVNRPALSPACGGRL